MTRRSIESRLALLALAATTVFMAVTAGAQAGAPPIKLIPESHFGAEVNAATKGDVCPVEAGSTCQSGVEGSAPGEFKYPKGVAVDNDAASPQYGDLYVADTINYRVQELTPSGAFVSMFGKEVDASTHGNVCTAASGDVCRAGAQGGAIGQFDREEAIAVDPASGDVYALEDAGNGNRVQKFTADGQFVLEIGREVNETTKGNLCTEEEVEKAGVKCTAPAQSPTGSAPEPGAFANAQALAVGGPEDLLYVGDEHGVQEFRGDGSWKGEISLDSISSEPESIVNALAVDQATGDVYVGYRAGPGAVVANDDVVRRFTADGEFAGSFTVAPALPGAKIEIASLALDGAGRLAVSAIEVGRRNEANFVEAVGSLYDAGTGGLITEMAGPGGEQMAFDGGDQLYAVVGPGFAPDAGHEVVVYKPEDVAELLADPGQCAAGPDRESDATFNCTFEGEANPEGVAETEAWFQWGLTTALGAETPKVAVPTGSAPVAVSAQLTGLAPNETFFYRPAGFDANVEPPQRALSGETTSLTTPVVAPRVVGEPSASFVHATSALLFGELNPEHANTRYLFQYAPAAACANLDNCPASASTETIESAVYGRIGTTSEVSGLQPATAYRYRLLASDGQLAAKGAESTFTTAPRPLPQAQTGEPSAIGATSATASASVNPDGQPASYAFELGVYAGAQTRYGIVSSGSVGASSIPVAESASLTGLQPGTTYAYRVEIASGYGTAVGESVTFTTEGLPTVLTTTSSLATLAIPQVAFPKAAGAAVSKNKSHKRSKKKRKASSERHRKTKQPHKGKK